MNLQNFAIAAQRDENKNEFLEAWYGGSDSEQASKRSVLVKLAVVLRSLPVLFVSWLLR
jgi:hypothetical protein